MEIYKEIKKQKNDEFLIDAKLHGMKVKNNAPAFNADDDKFFNEQAKKDLEEWQTKKN